MARVGNRFAVRESGEVLQAHVQPNAFASLGQWLGFNLCGEDNIPAVGFALDGAGFNNAGNLS